VTRAALGLDELHFATKLFYFGGCPRSAPRSPHLLWEDNARNSKVATAPAKTKIYDLEKGVFGAHKVWRGDNSMAPKQQGARPN
jgi:hypothetical protein